MKRIGKKISEYWELYYHIFIPICMTMLGTIVCWNKKIYLWSSNNYSDMLGAVITFLSIVISIFGILIPTVFTNKTKLVDFFVKNADTTYLVKDIKRVMASGISNILLVCLLYLQDIFPQKFYCMICVSCLFLFLYFLCGSYKYLSLLLRLVIETKEPHNGKKYEKSVDAEKQKAVAEMLKKQKKI